MNTNKTDISKMVALSNIDQAFNVFRIVIFLLSIKTQSDFDLNANNLQILEFLTCLNGYDFKDSDQRECV